VLWRPKFRSFNQPLLAESLKRPKDGVEETGGGRWGEEAKGGRQRAEGGDCCHSRSELTEGGRIGKRKEEKRKAKVPPFPLSSVSPTINPFATNSVYFFHPFYVSTVSSSLAISDFLSPL